MSSSIARKIHCSTAALLAVAWPIVGPAAERCEPRSSCSYDVIHQARAEKREPWHDFERNLGGQFAAAGEAVDARANDVTKEGPAERAEIGTPVAREQPFNRDRGKSDSMRVMLLWRLLGIQSKRP